MSDELREALATAEAFFDGTDYDFGGLTPGEQDTIVGAARRVAEADEVWWCRFHLAAGWDDHCQWGVVEADGGDCVMVPGRLLLPAEEGP